MTHQEREQEELQQIGKSWSESEWRLGFLRSFTNQPLPDLNDNELLAWDQHCKQLCSTSPTPPTT